MPNPFSAPSAAVNQQNDEIQVHDLVIREKLNFSSEKFDLDGRSRSLVFHKYTNKPPITACLFESSLSEGRGKNKLSSTTIVNHVCYLLTWAENNVPNFEAMLLSGSGLNLPQIKSFGFWLEGLNNQRSGIQLKRNYIQQIYNSCKKFVLWFVSNFSVFELNSEFNRSLMARVDAHKKCWADGMVYGSKDLCADDLSDMQIKSIETYMSAEAFREEKNDGGALRNYLIWRFAAAFGMRVGEILALRLEDLHLNSARPSLEIVHINERGQDYRDPRAPYHPRVKTLSRTLYFAPYDLDIVELIEHYISKFRVAKKNGATCSFLSHDFLFVVHGVVVSGEPVTVSAIQKVASNIRDFVVPKFHWHLVRHAFFNRQIASAKGSENYNKKIDSIVYIGGWRDSKSLDIYTRRATRDNAMDILMRRNLIGVSA